MTSFKPSVPPQSELSPEVIDALIKTEHELASLLARTSVWFTEILAHLGSPQPCPDAEEEDEAERLKRLQDEAELIEILRPRIWASLLAAVEEYVELRGLGPSERR